MSLLETWTDTSGSSSKLLLFKFLVNYSQRKKNNHRKIKLELKYKTDLGR